MPPITRFEEIEGWQTGRLLARRIYQLSASGTWSHDYGFRDQIRRSAVSVMSNIAEGYENGSPTQFLRYLAYAKGSAGELRAQLYVALDAGYLSQPTFEELLDLADKCSRQISRLMTYIRNREAHRVGEDEPTYDVEA